MTRIRCTQALLKILRIKPDETQDSLTSTPLGDWYAHLLWIERKKCILFTNEVTLFNFLALDVKKADLADMNTFFSREPSSGSGGRRYHRRPSLQASSGPW